MYTHLETGVIRSRAPLAWIVSMGESWFVVPAFVITSSELRPKDI